MHVLGIDAGGTKTVCQLADERGEVIAEARGSGANLRAVGQFEVERVFRRLIDDVLAHRDARVQAVCVGIAGADRDDDADVVRELIRRLGHDVPTVVVNDALVALVAGVGEQQPGVVIVAGTGSIAYGRDSAGRAARAGGWGYLLGDEGGGFWIGRAALSAVVRQFDQRGPATLLTDLVLTQMGLTTPAQVIQAVYDRLPRHVIAGIADVVEHATSAGDAVAAEILGRAATELVSAAASVVTRLEMRGEVFQTVLAGGIFRGIPSLAAGVELRMGEVAPRSTVKRLEVEPAHGAVMLALAAAHGRIVLPSYL